jgi:hypothetical protein
MKIPATCRCLTPKRRAFIRAKMNRASDFPEGAFAAYMDECGIDADELETFSTDHDCAKAAAVHGVAQK